MRATILTIGDELLIGQIVNSNASWIGERLVEIGVRPLRMLTVGDEKEIMTDALTRAMQETRIVIMTGGLGPTHDDITRDVIADVFGVDLEFDPEIVEQMRQRFEAREREMPDSNRVQALVPAGFDAILNPLGTAPALMGTFDHTEGDGLLVALPGVPYEMEHFLTENVIPRILSMEGAPHVVQKTLLTVGVSESRLADELAGVEQLLGKGISLAFLPNLRGVRLRLTAVREKGADVSSFERLEQFVRDRAAEWIYGEGEDSLEAVIGRLLQEQGRTVATAESCTGGYVAHRLTNVAGSSAWVVGGVVSYANRVKENQLGVSPATIEEHGAVSRQTACEMASGIRTRLGADIGISTTGILGPGGGTEAKPVGTFWMGISTEARTVALRLRLGTDRIRNKERASTAVLDLLRRELMNQEENPMDHS